MLKFGDRKRVERVLQPHLEPGETIHVSLLGILKGQGDFAIGVTESRILWVGVTRLLGRPNGTFFVDEITEVEIGQPGLLSVPIIRSDGSTVQLMTDGTWNREVAAFFRRFEREET